MSKSFVGTPQYMSYELRQVLAGKYDEDDIRKIDDFKSDVFSLGIVIG